MRVRQTLHRKAAERASKRRPALQGLRLFQVSDARVLIGRQAHPVEAQAQDGDNLAAATTAREPRKAADLRSRSALPCSLKTASARAVHCKRLNAKPCAGEEVLAQGCAVPEDLCHLHHRTCPRLSSAAAAHWLFGFSNFASSMGTLCFTSVSLMVKLKSDRT